MNGQKYKDIGMGSLAYTNDFQPVLCGTLVLCERLSDVRHEIKLFCNSQKSKKMNKI